MAMTEMPPLPRWRIIGRVVRDGLPEVVMGYDGADMRAYGDACALAALETAANECGRLWTRAGDADQCEDAIRALATAFSKENAS
jgi:hypothetical protein